VCVCASGFNPGQKEKGEGGGYILSVLCVITEYVSFSRVCVCFFISAAAACGCSV
jgi:hypothetical protein